MPVQAALSRFSNDLLDFFFPRWCVVCGLPPETADPLCAQCRDELGLLPHPVCPFCLFFLPAGLELCPQGHHPDLLPVWAAGLFDHHYRRLIHAFKFDDRPDCGDFLARRLGALLENDPRLAAVDLVVPVPLHPTRRRERGFNQSELLARAAGAALARPVDNLLFRSRNTKSQTELDGPRRRQNVAGAFRVAHGTVPPVVLLVDDVFTTGATMQECAATLLGAGAQRVMGAVVALAEPAGRPGPGDDGNKNAG
jgi:ComF family protein